MSAEASVTGMLDVFDVAPTAPDRFTGFSAEGVRVDGTQLLAQAIVAAAKRFPAKSVRSAHALFCRAVAVDEPVDFVVDVVHDGRTMSTAQVIVEQRGRRCDVVTVLLDIPSEDVIRHHAPRPDVASAADAVPSDMPMTGREVRLVDAAASRELHAWLRYDPIPAREDLAKALIAHFTGHLAIPTTLQAHPQQTLSTVPMTVTVGFHEPVRWDGWLLYSHASTYAGAGMAYVRGQVHTEAGDLLASFSHQAMIRSLRPQDSRITTAARL